MIIKLISYLICLPLWFLGGWDKAKWSGYRDVLIPIIIGASLGWFIPGVWWVKLLIGFFSIGTYQIIRLGYGNYEPENDPKPSFLAKITHDRNGWWIRSIWGFLVGIVGPLAVIIHKDIAIWIYLCYILGNSLIGFSVSRFKLPVLVTDLIVAAGIASIIFLI